MRHYFALCFALCACSEPAPPSVNYAVEAAQDVSPKADCKRPHVIGAIHSALCTFPVEEGKTVTMKCRTDGSVPLICEEPLVVPQRPPAPAAESKP